MQNKAANFCTFLVLYFGQPHKRISAVLYKMTPNSLEKAKVITWSETNFNFMNQSDLFFSLCICTKL